MHIRQIIQKLAELETPEEREATARAMLEPGFAKMVADWAFVDPESDTPEIDHSEYVTTEISQAHRDRLAGYSAGGLPPKFTVRCAGPMQR